MLSVSSVVNEWIGRKEAQECTKNEPLIFVCLVCFVVARCQHRSGLDCIQRARVVESAGRVSASKIVTGITRGFHDWVLVVGGGFDGNPAHHGDVRLAFRGAPPPEDVTS